ncbi:UNVERIFIED_CONTAM: beta-galactosidase, partial [Prevotella sp. 15_C9]
DWILQKKYLKDRSNDVVYQNYVKRYFTQIANQLKGLYYKDGGNIIGIQLENEYWYGKEGEPHIQWLKDTALENGIDVPMYTV